MHIIILGTNQLCRRRFISTLNKSDQERIGITINNGPGKSTYARTNVMQTSPGLKEFKILLLDLGLQSELLTQFHLYVVPATTIDVLKLTNWIDKKFCDQIY